MRDPFTAGILSLLIPGVGQLYNGRILAGILWLIITPGFWIGTGGTLGWICHIIAAYTAYSYAKDHPVRTSEDPVCLLSSPPFDKSRSQEGEDVKKTGH